MQEDFHYYATYSAAYIAGFSHEESMDICYSAQLVDLCSRAFLSQINGPSKAATTQLQLELADTTTDILGLQDITRIWASFHFLPKDLYAEPGRGGKHYKNKYRLICGPNSDLLVKTVELAKGKSLQAAGIAMHILADTWAHMYFAGTPSLVINNTNYYFYECIEGEDGYEEREIKFRHSKSAPDNLDKSLYTCSLYQGSENSIMNLGHGRAGHIPDYSFIRYKYLPAWGDYDEIIKDNPTDYMNAFCQMIYAMKYLRGEVEVFEKDTYDRESIAGMEDEIDAIFRKRQLDSCKEWKAFGEKLSGKNIEKFDLQKFTKEYTSASKKEKDNTFLGRFIDAAIRQKSMVTDEIYKSGSILAGYSVKRIAEVFKNDKET